VLKTTQQKTDADMDVIVDVDEVVVEPIWSIVEESEEMDVLEQVKEDQDVMDPQREPLNDILRKIGLFKDSDPSPNSKEEAVRIVIQHFKTERVLFQWWSTKMQNDEEIDLTMLKAKIFSISDSYNEFARPAWVKAFQVKFGVKIQGVN
jgi:hypothetical protein